MKRIDHLPYAQAAQDAVQAAVDAMMFAVNFRDLLNRRDMMDVAAAHLDACLRRHKSRPKTSDYFTTSLWRAARTRAGVIAFGRLQTLMNDAGIRH